jgi:hypothetical protein
LLSFRSFISLNAARRGAATDQLQNVSRIEAKLQKFSSSKTGHAKSRRDSRTVGPQYPLGGLYQNHG